MRREIPFMRTALYGRAHASVAVAVREGKIAKPKTCEMCGQEKRLLAHHEDYSQPLAVEWLCSACHRVRHLVEGSAQHSDAKDSTRACETDALSAGEKRQ